MQQASREPSMEEILASIKKVIAQEKGERGTARPEAVVRPAAAAEPELPASDEVLELDQPLAPPVDLGPPLVDDSVAGRSRQALDQLSTIAASAPQHSQANPLEDVVREMLRPMLKQWLDENLPQIVQEHVHREISRITGRPN